MNSVFEQLNRGESVTSGLRRVERSEMTHKNPALRAGSTVPERADDSTRGRPSTKPKPDTLRSAAPTRPARAVLEGNKWIVENYEGAEEPIALEVKLTQSVLITRCNRTTIRLNGKANAVSIDSSARCNLIIDSLVSSVDVVKSPNFALQVLGALPTVLLDQVDGATVYLSSESLHTEVLTSKCSSVNVNLPGDDGGDYRECPLPEQLRSVVRDGKVVSEIVEHAA